MKTETTICDIRNNNQLRNEFIEKHINYILAITSKVVGRYINKEDDYFSIALIVFDEAITKYDENKGSFWNFAEVMIRNRLIDEFRKQKHNVIPFSGLTQSDSTDEDEIFDVVGQSDIASDLAFEFYALKAELECYQIALFELPKYSPKARKTKKMVYQSLMYLSEHKSAKDIILKKHELPMKLLETQVGANRKLLERHRKYIIAGTIILNGDYPIIAEYIKNIGEVSK